MAVIVRWYGDDAENFTRKQLNAGIAAATQELQNIARQMASIPNTGVSVPVKRQTRGGNKTSRTTYPNSSKPGEPPRRRTGAGQKGILLAFAPALQIGRVGFSRNVRYMTFHELGITYGSGKQQRPTILPAVRNNMRRLSAIFVRAARRVAKG